MELKRYKKNEERSRLITASAEVACTVTVYQQRLQVGQIMGDKIGLNGMKFAPPIVQTDCTLHGRVVPRFPFKLASRMVDFLTYTHIRNASLSSPIHNMKSITNPYRKQKKQNTG